MAQLNDKKSEDTVRTALKVAMPLVVIVAGVGAIVALNAAKQPPEKDTEGPRPVSLQVETVRADTVNVKVRTQGEVRAKTEIGLVPQVAGRIVSISDTFSEGGSFQPDETLIKIEDSDYRLAVVSAEARVAEASVRLEQELADARIKRKQWEDWVKDGDPTPLALNQPQVAEAQSKLRAAEADLENARVNLARTEIKVPFKGRVRERTVGVGQFVQPGTTLGRVFATDIVEIRLPLTDAQIGELSLPIGFVAEEGKAPKVTFSATVGGKQRSWDGEIVRVNASIDNQTRLVYAIAEVEDPYGAAADEGMPMAVGVFVSAEVEGVTAHDALVIPRSALRKENQAYVINSDNKLEIRTLNVLSTSSDNVMITAGLRAGDQVVTAPVRGAFDGMSALPIVRTAGQPAPTAR